MQVHANEGGVTQTRGGIYWIILPAGCKAPTHSLPLPYTSLGNNTNKKAKVAGSLVQFAVAELCCAELILYSNVGG